MQIASNDVQLMVFNKLSTHKDLIVSFKMASLCIDLVGSVEIRSESSEDRVYISQSKHHVHIDWSKLKFMNFDRYNSYKESCLTFYSEDGVFF